MLKIETEEAAAKRFQPEAEYLLSNRDWEELFGRRHSILHDAEDVSDLRSILVSYIT